MDTLVQTIVQGLMVGSSYGLIALSLGLIYSVSGITNFSQGDFLVLCMFGAFSLFRLLGIDSYLSVVITVPILIVLTVLIYKYLIQPIAGQQLMVIQLTLGLMFIVQNVLLMIYGGHYQRVPSILDGEVLVIGNVLVLQYSLIVAFLVTWVIAALLFFVLSYTDFGRSVRAVHQNARAAALQGINVRYTQLVVFSMSAAILGVAAALLLPGKPLHPAEGLHYTVVGLMPLVLGGMSNFLGILMSGLLIGTAEAVGSVYLNGAMGFALPYVIFIAILVFRPQGIFGAK
jgi:branched-chain amino acid transport system permease protein